MRFEVREATEHDIPGIQAAYLRSWRAAYDGLLDTHVLDNEVESRRSFNWSRGIEAPTAAVFVAVDEDDRVVGVVQADEDLPQPRDLPEITMLYVDPSVWGSGIASDVIGAAIAWIAGRSHTTARLRVVEQHARARRFYERHGWQPDPDLEPARNSFFKLIYYRRSLTARSSEP